MKSTKSLLFTLLAASICACNASAAINLTFDGTTGGWTASNNNPVTGVQTVGGMALDGIAFEDEVTGYSYYLPPASFLSGLDLTGETVNFNIFIEDNSATSVLADETAGGPADIRINGTAIDGLDIIDESQLGVVQSVSVDFTDPIFNGLDLTNITEFGIRAEFWKSGPVIDPIESYLVSVPEPGSLSLVGACLVGLLFLRKKK